MKFWKVLALILIGGILIETTIGYFIIRSLSRDLDSVTSQRDDYRGASDRLSNRIEQSEKDLRGALSLAGEAQDRVGELQREIIRRDQIITGFLGDLGSGLEDSISGIDRVQDNLRELGARATEGERAD